MPQQKKVAGGYIFHVGDEVLFDSPQGWKKGEIVKINNITAKIKTSGTSVLQVVKFSDIQPTHLIK